MRSYCKFCGSWCSAVWLGVFPPSISCESQMLSAKKWYFRHVVLFPMEFFSVCTIFFFFCRRLVILWKLVLLFWSNFISQSSQRQDMLEIVIVAVIHSHLRRLKVFCCIASLLNGVVSYPTLVMFTRRLLSQNDGVQHIYRLCVLQSIVVLLFLTENFSQLVALAFFLSFFRLVPHDMQEFWKRLFCSDFFPYWTFCRQPLLSWTNECR